MTTGELAKAAGVHTETIRYYERRGILAEPPRTSSGYRQYDAGAAERLRFIKRAQSLGFSLEDIGSLLELRPADAASCDQAVVSVRKRLSVVESRLRELERLRRALRRFEAACLDRSSGAPCPLIEMLEEPPLEMLEESPLEGAS